VLISGQYYDSLPLKDFRHTFDLERKTMDAHKKIIPDSANRRSFVGGSDARIIIRKDEPALLRLWREKRGEAELEDSPGILSSNSGA
jgi:hypothetical protein